MKLRTIYNELIRIVMLAVFALMLVAVIFNDISYASDSNKKTIISQRTIHFADYYKDYNGEDATHSSRSVSMRFRTNRKMIFMIPIEVTVTTDDSLYVSRGGIRIVLKNDRGKIIQNDYINLKGYRNGDVYEGWVYSNGFFQRAGAYTYTITWSADEDCYVKCSVVGYSKFAKKVKLKKKVSKRSGNWVKIGKLGEGFPYVKRFKSSNKKVVPYIDVAANGNVYAYAKGKGTAKITISLKNGKRYSSVVTVKPGDPNMMAFVYDYDTRDNYFVVKVKNNSPHSITIIRNGGKIKNVDYKSFDRNTKGGNVTVKPGKTKYVRFYLKGSPTWYDSSDYTLYSKIRYEGKTYEWHVWDEDSVYKKNKKWYSTYWQETIYNEWVEAD